MADPITTAATLLDLPTPETVTTLWLADRTADVIDESTRACCDRLDHDCLPDVDLLLLARDLLDLTITSAKEEVSRG